MPTAHNRDELTQISGTVEAVTFHNEENGFTVFMFSTEDELVTAVGTLFGVCVGEKMTLYGNWDYHSNFGRQFKISEAERAVPETAAAFLKYLSSGAIKGIGPSTALKIVEYFGDKTFDILENEPVRLTAIKGISTQKAMKYSDEFRKQFAIRETILSLGNYGLTTAECIRVYKKFGGRSFELISGNPYLLCGDDINIGFAKVDEIAQKLNPSAPYCERIRAGVVYVIKHNMRNGHTCVPRDKLIPPCRNLLGAGEDEIQIEIDNMIDAKTLVSVNDGKKDNLYLPKTYKAEMEIAQRLKMFKKFPPICAATPESEIERTEEEIGIRYEDLQRLAILEAMRRGIVILTGGPGTGKTTTLKGIIHIMERQGLDVTLTAPTGRAAKRMSEVTGREAKTVHRLLEAGWSEGDERSFSRNEQNPLDTDVIIIDEISMVDVYLFAGLLQALPLGCRIIMVGDSNQLPSVGEGNVLEDLILSEQFPVIRLNEIFRQSENSLIINNAHRIINGEMPDLSVKDSDFFHISINVQNTAIKTVVSLCCERLPAAYGYSPLADIQILCPSRKGELGTASLNRIMQARLNPHEPGKPEIERGGRVLRVGDKVMQTVNNYDIIWSKDDGTSGLGVFNGDIGIIEKIDHQDNCVVVRYDDRTASHPLEDISELEHAYAITVHKSQGSEFEAVVIPTLFVPEQLSYRNLFYTAVTRAKKLLITVGSADTIRRMVENKRKARRYTCLKYFMLQED